MAEGGTAKGRPAGGPSETAAFHTAIPAFSAFEAVGDPGLFVPLPDDWLIGLADVVSSTAAIAAGRYRAVNTAGAAVISAVSNALRTLDFPFLFAGDGASFAVGPAEAEAAAEALAATVAWAGRELGLAMRGGIVRVAAIRAAGLDVRVARFAASPGAAYAMFSGGGMGWAEERLKAGMLAAPTSPPGAVPDLSGLSCRFRDIRSRHGVILSVLARPAAGPGEPRFRALLAELLALARHEADAGKPLADTAPLLGVAPRAIALNARVAGADGGSRLGGLLRVAGQFALIAPLLAFRLRLGRFSARRYLAEVVANADFRKYDDGLMLTLDCTDETAAAIADALAAAERAGVAHYGLHRQRAATITCMVPAAGRPDHVHFIDGAAGGYAMAAQSLKAQLVARQSV